MSPPKTVPLYLASLGCPKNLVDSEVMLGLLTRDRYRIVADPAQAEVIIVNTCTFIHDARDESVQTILEMAEHKKKGSCRVLVVTGCLVQRYPKELREELPEVDLFVGTGEYLRIAELLARPSRLKNRPVVAGEPKALHRETHPRIHTGPAYSGFLKISEGCNRRCSFCVIPGIRGEVRSRTVGSLVTEARRMAAQGVKELNLVAQDLTEYGADFRRKGDSGQTLEALLPALCAVEGIEWVRLHYVYPDDFTDGLIELIAREPRIVKYLDLPLQHTQDGILRAMNRRIKRERIFSLVGKLRKRVPGIAIRTSIIVGFPGETAKDFRALCKDLRELALDSVGVFEYSREEGTKAAELPGHVPASVRARRARTLSGILEKASLKKMKLLVGRTFPVLIEGPSDESDLLLQGRMPTQAAGIDGHVLINEFAPGVAPDGLLPGRIVKVKITAAMPHDVIGRIVRP